MKKFIFISVFVFALSLFLVPVKADTNYYDQFETIAIMPNFTTDNPPLVGIMLSTQPVVYCRNGWCDGSFNSNSISRVYYFNSVNEAYAAILTGVVKSVDTFVDCYNPFIVIKGSIVLQSGNATIYDDINEYWDEHPDERPTPPPDPDPPEPEPGDSWLSDIWEWFLWQLGLNDDYSGDIDEYITGGDRDRIEIVTPTPTPFPPSPTPIVMPITDTNGNTIWNVTYPQGDSGGGDTTNNYYGDDFDIFDVDLKIGDGGTSNPRDGLNDVMDTSFDYVNELDTSAVSGSFSILPTDWYVMIGVLICFPFIAGFISKLLK